MIELVSDQSSSASSSSSSSSSASAAYAFRRSRLFLAVGRGEALLRESVGSESISIGVADAAGCVLEGVWGLVKSSVVVILD